MPTIPMPFDHAVADREGSVRIRRSTIDVDVPAISTDEIRGRFPIRHAKDAADLRRVEACVLRDRIALPVSIDGVPVLERDKDDVLSRLAGAFASKVSPPAFPIETVHTRSGVRPAKVWNRFAKPRERLVGERDLDRERMAELSAVDAAELVFVGGVLHVTRHEPVFRWKSGGELVLNAMWIDRHDGPGKLHVSHEFERLGAGLCEAVIRSFASEKTHPIRVPGNAFLADDFARPPSRLPMDAIRLRLLCERTVACLFGDIARCVRTGSGDPTEVECHEALDDAWFALRAAGRRLPADLRGGPADPLVVVAVLDATDAFLAESRLADVRWNGTTLAGESAALRRSMVGEIVR